MESNHYLVIAQNYLNATNPTQDQHREGINALVEIGMLDEAALRHRDHLGSPLPAEKYLRVSDVLLDRGDVDGSIRALRTLRRNPDLDSRPSLRREVVERVQEMKTYPGHEEETNKLLAELTGLEV